MCLCSAHLRSKKNWWKDIQNENLRREWRSEALDSQWNVRVPGGHVDANLSDKQVCTPKGSKNIAGILGQVDYVLDELSGYAALVDEEHKWYLYSTANKVIS
jgi:hypothetical protein